MSEVFKCGDIANIINENQIKVKKQTKLSKKFKNIIRENQNKVIEIKKNDYKQLETHESVVVEEEEEDIKETEDNEELNVKQEKEDMTEKNRRTSFVGNLPKSITKKILKQMFTKFGEIQSIRLRGAVPQKEKMSKKVAVITKSFHSKKDNINAYVVFDSEESVLKSLELNGSVVDGHHIRVDSAANDVIHDSLRSVFAGNLPFDIKEEELYEFFEECGTIESVRVVRDSNTGVGKGFGFILFKSKDSVVLALEKNDKKIRKRNIRVTRAKNTQNKPKHSFKRMNESNEQKSRQKVNKKPKNSDSKPEFEGISATKTKKKIKKKKEMKSIKMKKKQKKLSQIFSK